MGCIISLLQMWFRSLTFSSSSSSAADSAAGDADNVVIPPPREKYDVFISFRGEDTRRGITSHLHYALEQKKIETYIDYRLQRGEAIESALREAIEKSRLSVIIFSKDYGSSPWCLEELVHLLECNKMVIPVFYDIDPSHVRKQQGSYAVAFARHEKRFKGSIDKVHKWRKALTTAANLSGFHYSNNSGTEAELIKKVVDDIWTKLVFKSSSILEGLVGIESHVKQIESLLDIHSQDACITIGIWGMGGIGKTTLSETVFDKLSSDFEASCFLRNVRENLEQPNGLDHLEKKLLKKILDEKDPNKGSTFVRERLSRTKVLIVLDDVSDSMQMEHFAGNRLRYGIGSRIIITSRDKRTFRETVEEDKIYQLEGLKQDDALKLFYSRAFKNNSTSRIDYKELAEKAVDYAGGIPLALVHLGSSFLNCKSKEEWKDELKNWEKLPNEKIQKVLRLSYDGLEGDEKEIFLDIACFHKGKDVDEVIRMLDIRGFLAARGIRVLVDMSLVSIDSRWNAIEVHDLLQEMGSTIVQKQCIEDPSKRNRLFKDEDVNDILKNNTGTPIVQAILMNWYKIEGQTLKRADFRVMSKLMMLIVVNSLDRVNSLDPPNSLQYPLRCLQSSFSYENLVELPIPESQVNKIRNEGLFGSYSLDLPNSLRYLNWRGYPLKSLPSNFSPENLVELHMPESQVNKLWNEDQRLVNLKVIDLKGSKYLTEVPNLSGSPKIVNINLDGCERLVEIPGDFQHLHELTYLNLRGCKCLKHLPDISRSPKIVHINLDGCERLVEIPGDFQHFHKLTYLNLRGCKCLKHLPDMPENIAFLDLYGSGIQELPESVWSNKNISYLNISHCKDLKKLPSNKCKLKVSDCFDLGYCESLSEFSELPRDISQLSLVGCKRLVSLPTDICKLKYLKELKLSLCPNLENFPEILEPMEHLEYLYLSGTEVQELHSSIEFLPALKEIELQGCKRLSSIPESICKLKSLNILNLRGCPAFYEFPQILEPMEHLNLLILKGTALEKLPSSIGNLIGLQTLDLDECKNLNAVPRSIYSLTNLATLKFRDCWGLKELPSGSVGLLSLKVLDLFHTRISEIPDGVVGLTSLQDLDLTGTMIRTIPASIKQASRLHTLSLIGCKQLQSLPELPVLCNLKAQGCTSLKTVSSSRAALTQDWDKYVAFGKLDFFDCPKLDHNARSNIMDDAQLRVMRVATEPLENPYGCDDLYASIVCPGKEIPNWFSCSYQSEGPSVHIKLPPDWFRTGLLGFALSVVVSCVSNCQSELTLIADFNVKFLGESHELFSSVLFIPQASESSFKESNDYCYYPDHMYVWTKRFRSEEVTQKCSLDVYKLANEASVEFEMGGAKVLKYGICPLYA